MSLSYKKRDENITPHVFKVFRASGAPAPPPARATAEIREVARYRASAGHRRRSRSVAPAVRVTRVSHVASLVALPFAFRLLRSRGIYRVRLRMRIAYLRTLDRRLKRLYAF